MQVTMLTHRAGIREPIPRSPHGVSTPLAGRGRFFLLRGPRRDNGMGGVAHRSL